MELGQENATNGIKPNSVPPAEEKAVPNVLPLPEIVFPPEHAVSKLRMVWQGNGVESEVRLALSHGQDVLPLVEHQMGEEVQLLRETISQAARKRCEQLWRKLSQGEPPDLDEEAVVCLSKDVMVAWLLLFPPVGAGQKRSMLQLLQALSSRGVCNGVNVPRLKEISGLPDRYFQLYPVACGTLPIPGEDGSILEKYPCTPEENTDIQEMAKEDYISLNLVQDIQEGDIICEIIPPGKGIAGHTVTGVRVPAPMGKEPVIPQGRNTEVSKDGRYLVASQFGHVEYKGRNYHVKPVLEILKSLESPEESVNFMGDVHIHGDVLSDVTVRAMGNIQVDGVIEGCIIEAGEHLVVSSGVQGQNAAVIRAHKSIYAKYLEHCKVYAKESVVADYIIDCQVYSDGTVKVCSGRGAIIGGNVWSASEVSALSVGSKAERLTSIELGGLPCEDFERMQIQQEYEKACQEVEQEEKKPETPEQRSRLSKMRLNVYVIQMKLDKFNKDVRNALLAHSEEDHRRLICDTIYPGTVVTIGNSAFRVESIRENCRIGLIGKAVRYI